MTNVFVYADARARARNIFISLVFFCTKRSQIIRQLFKKAVNRTSFAALFIVVLSIGGSLDNPAWSNPSGEKVVAGGVSFERDGNNLIITQGTNRAIVDWQDFSVRVGESTNFLQPDAASAILNRVVSSNPSEIFGNLNANGQVFLINQNGILVGESGVIDTNGFVASTLDVTNDAFMAGGSMSFVGDSDAAIINLGKVKGIDGDIILIARNIENNGELSSENGTVALAAGSEVLLKASGDEKILIQAGSTDASVTNSGLIEATNAELKAMGGNEFALAINNEGAVRATGTEERDGRIWLIAEKGTTQNTGELTATSGDKGGKIQVLGDRVSVKGDSVLNASGTQGGGEILIGGDFQGKNVDIKNADRTFIGSDATLIADATENGDGGKIIVWADGDTNYQGDISVTGGNQSGNGGFVEVSGKEDLSFRGTVDASAANGNGGSLLLDPENITIADGGGDALATNNEFAENAGSDVTIDTVAIEALIDADTDVTFQAHDDITISDAIISDGAGVMTFEAGRNITVDGTINTNNSNIFFYINDTNATPTVAAVSEFTNNALINAGTANVTISADNTATVNLVNISTGIINSQDLNLTHLETDQGGTITLEGITINGNLTINASTGDVDVLNATADGSIRVIGATKITTAGDVDIQGTNTDLEEIGLIANNVTIYDKKALQIGTDGFTSTVSGTLNLDIVGPVGNAGVVNVVGRTYIKTTDGGFGIDEPEIDLSFAINDFSEVIVDQDSTGLEAKFKDANDIIIGGTFGGNLDITTIAGNMRDFTQGEMDALTDPTFSSGHLINSSNVAPLTFIGASETTLDAGNAGNITFDHANTDFDYLRVNNANVVVINDKDAIELYSSTTQGNYTLDAGGNINLVSSNVFTIGGAMDLQNSAGYIYVEDSVDLNITNGLSFTSDASYITFSNYIDTIITSGDMDITAAGNVMFAYDADATITDGDMNVTATGTVEFGSQDDITLTDGSVNINAGGTVYFDEYVDIDVNTTDTVDSGQLNVTAGGDISQYQSETNRGSLKVEGKSTFTVTAADSDLLLQQAANDMEGTVTMSATAEDFYRDVNFRNIHDGVAVLSGLESAGEMHNVTLFFDNAPSLELPGMTLTGNLTVDVPLGLVTQADEIIVAGDAYFDVSSALDITLDDVDNDFNDIIFEQANDVVLIDTDGFNFYSYHDGVNWRGTDLTGNLTVTAGGNVTQTNSPYGVMVDGLSTFTLGANDLTLNNFSYNQWNQIQIVSANNVLLHTETDLEFLTSNVAGTFELNSGATSLDITQANGSTITSGGNTTFYRFDNITLNNAGNVFGPLYINDGNDISYTGTTSIREDDAITQSQAWSTYYDTIILTVDDDQAITLDNTSNRFGDMQITQINAGNATPGAVHIADTIDGTGITQNGAWTTHGDTTLNSGNYSITLTNTSNVLGDLKVDGGKSTYWDGSNDLYYKVEITENDAITDFSAWTTNEKTPVILKGYALGVLGDGNVILDSVSNVLGGLTVVGNNVTIVEDSNITDYSTRWQASGDVLLNAGNAHDIILDGSDWTDGGMFQNSGNILGAIDVKGAPSSVVIYEDSDITQSNSWTVGTAPVYLNAKTNNIAMTQPGNVLGNIEIIATNGTPNSVSIRENDAITQSSEEWLLTGKAVTLFAENDKAITLIDVDNMFGDLEVTGGTVSIVENDDITDGGAWTTTGTTTLNPGSSAAKSIVLNNPDNVLGDIAISGDPAAVTILENDSITQASAWSLSGDTVTLTVTDNNDIVLTQAANVLGDLNLTAGGTGNVSVTENDVITDGTAWTVGDTATLTAGANNITLNVSGNLGTLRIVTAADVDVESDIDTIQIDSATNVTIEDTDGIDFNTSSVTALLDVTAGGHITQTGGAIAAGNLRLVGTGYATLENVANDVDNIAAGFSGGNLSFVDTDDFAVATLAGTVGIGVGANEVSLRSVNNTLTGISDISNLTSALTINTGTALSLPSMIIGGSQTYTAGGAGITLNSGIQSTAAGDITFNSPVTLATDLTIQTKNATDSDIYFKDTVAGGTNILTVNADNGQITFDKAISGFGLVGDAQAVLNLTAGGTGTLVKGTVATNGGITVTGPITFQDDVTLADGNSGSVFAGQVTLGKVGGMDLSGYDTIRFSGGVVLADGASTITSNDSLLTFENANTVDGAFDLILNSGTAEIAGLEYIGTNITSLTVTGDEITVPSAGLQVNGPISLTSTGGTSTFLEGDVETTAAGTITFNSQVKLSASASVTSDGTVGDDINFESTVDGNYDLTVNSGAAITNFKGAVGSGSPLGDATGAALIVQNTGVTNFDSTVETRSGITSTGSGAVVFDDDVTMGDGNTGSSFTGAVTLGKGGGAQFAGYDGITFTGGVNLTGGAVEVVSNGSTIAFGNTVSGAQNLTLTALSGGAGTVTGLANVDTNLTALTIVAQTLSLPSITINGLMEFTAAGGITTNGALETTADGTGTITFNSAVALATGDNSITTVNSQVDFNDTLSGAQDFVISTGTGAKNFDAAVSNIGDGTGAAMTFNGSGAITFASTSSANSGVVVNNGAAVIIQDSMTLANADTGSNFGTGLVTIGNGSGTTAISGYDGITFGGAVALTAGASSVTSNDSALLFSGAVTGNQNLTLNSGTSTTTFSSAVGGSIAGDAIGTGVGAAITTSGSGLTRFTSTLNTASGITAAGPVQFDDDVTMADGNTGTNISGAVTMGNAGGLSFAAYDSVVFGSTVALQSGSTSIDSNDGDVSVVGAVNGAQAFAIDSGTGDLELQAASGGATALTSIDLDGAAVEVAGIITTGTQDITGTAVTLNSDLTTTDSKVTITGPVTLGGNTTIDVGDADIEFTNTIDGAKTLELNFGSGTTTLTGAVGNDAQLTSLITDAGGVLNINGGSVSTTGIQTYNGNIILGADTALIGSTVTTNGTVKATTQGVEGLAITGNGIFADTIGAGAKDLEYLTVSGTSALNGASVTTTGVQTYSGVTTINATGNATTLTGTGITFGSTLRSTTDAEEALIIADDGTTTYTGAVGDGGKRLLSLLVNGGGTTNIDGGSVNTSTTQQYDNAIVLGTDTTLTGTTVTTNSTVKATTQGVEGLAITGNAVFADTIGAGAKDLEYLTVSGTSAINGASVTTTGVQTYSGASTIDATGNSTTLTGTGITFGSTLRSTTDAEEALIVADDGTTTFTGTVGDGGKRLLSLHVNGGGTINIDGGSVTTSNLQQYNNEVVLGADTTLTGFYINLNNTVKSLTQGVEGLAITGDAYINSTIGADSKDLEYLTVSDRSFIAGDTITTTGIQTYSGATSINNGSHSFTLTGTGISFGSTLRSPIDGDNSLSIVDDGITTFSGAIGDSGKRIKTLLISGGGTINLDGGSINTSTTQQYDNAITIGADTTLTGTSITLNSSLNGGHNFDIDASSNVVLDGVVGGATALSSLDVDGVTIGMVATTSTGTIDLSAVGGITLGGDLTTTNSTITITGPASLDSDLEINTGAVAGNIVLSGATSTINGVHDLILAAGTGDVTLGGVVGGIAALTSIDVSGNNLTLPVITTDPATAQTYNALNNITLNQSRTHSAAVTYTADSDNSGAGDFILLDGVSLGVTNQALNINAADLDMQGSSTMSAGSGKITITAKGDNNIALGGTDGAGKLVITGDELQRISTSNELELKTAGAGDIVVTGITGANSINVSGKTTLNASATGDIDFTTTASTFNELELTAAGGAINVGVNLNTADKNMTFTTAATVSGASTIDSNGGDISFNSTLDVDNSLVLTTDGGNLTFSGNVGSTDTLTMNLTGGAVAGLDQLQSTLTGLTINSTSGVTLPAIEINGLQEYNTGLITAQGNLTGIGITFNNIVTIDGNNLEFNAKTGTLTFANNAAAAANNITLTGDKIEIDDAMTGTGDWTLQPFTTTRNIQFGGGDNGGAILDLASDELALLPAAPSSLTIGRSNGTGTLIIADDLDYGSVPLNLRAGSIAQTGSLTAADPSLLANGGTIVLTNAANDLGAIAISGTPTAVTITDTTEITQDGAWVLGAANLTLDATGNNITLEQATNTFGTISLAGADASIFEAASTDLGASTLANLTVVSSDLILTSGTLIISGKGDFESRKDGGANITIANSTEIGEVSAESRNAADNANAAGNIFLSLAESATLDQITTTGMVTLTAANTKTFDQTGTSTITAGNLLLLGAGGTHTLTAGTNTLSAIAANTGDIAVVEADGLQISSINGTDGITTTGDTSLNVSGTITQTQAITATGLAITSSDAVTLTNVGNDVDNLAASVSSGSFSFTDTDGLTVDTVDGVTGVTVTSGDFIVQAGGTVNQNEAIAANGLKLTGAAAMYILNNSGNAISTLAANTNGLHITDDSGFVIGTVDGTNGLTTTANVTLTSAGNVTQAQAINVSGGLALRGTGTYTLTNSSNDIDTLATNTGSVSIRDTDTFVIGAVSGPIDTFGATTTGDLTVQTNGELTQTQALTIGGDLSITTTHNAGDVTLNNTGATATVIGDSLIGGNYDLTATGDAVTQSAGTGLKVAGTTDVTSASVSFGGTGNIFQGAVTTPARAELIAGGVITLGNINESGDYAVTSVASADSFDAGAIAGNAVTLTNAANNVAGAISVTTDAPSITDAGDVQTGINQGVGTTIVINGTASFTAEDSTVGGSGIITLNNTGNDFGSLVLSGTTVSVTEDTGATVIQSVDASTSLTVVSAGTITQTGPIVVPTLTATSNGLINLSDVDNDVDTFIADASAVTGSNVTFVDVDGFNVAGITVDAADVVLTAGGSGNITQTVALTGVDNLTVTAGGSIDLDENAVNNEIVTLGTITAGTGVAIADSDGDLTIDGDITATTGDVLVRADGGNLILADTRIITVNGAGDIYLAAGVGANFTNNDSTPGTSALVLDTGRFIIYSDNNSAVTKGGLTGDEYMNRTYAANGPAWADANDAVGNRFYYSDQATLTFTAVDKVKTYGDVNPALTYEVTGYLTGDNAASSFTGAPSLTTVADANSNVATYTITITQNTVAPLKGYAMSFANGVLSVGQAALTVKADDDSKTYDGLAYSGGNGVSYSGFVLGQNNTALGGTLSYAGTSQGATNVGGYVITPQGLTSSNYDITFADGALTVNQAALTIDADADSKTYDGLAYSGGNGVTYSGFVNGETNAVLGGSLSYAGTSQGATNAGGYLITPQGQTSGNYAITFANGALTVGQAALTVDADDASKTYDGLAYSGGNGVTYTGFVNSETSAVLGGSLSYAGTSQGATNAGGYVLTPQGQTSSNYNITFTNGALTVNQAALSVTADADSKTYDGLAYSGGNGVTYTGFVNSETSAVLGGSLSYAGTSQGATNVGGYVLTPQGQTSSNYNVTFNDGALTVGQAALTIDADDASKTYDGLAYSGGNGVTYTGFVNSETSAVLGGALSYAGTSQGATNAGGYVLTPQGQTSSNYDITFTNGALTVNQAALSVTADADSKTYDGLAYSGGNGVTYSGFVNSETSAVLGGSLSYAGTSQGATNAGGYLITPQGQTSGNYAITFADGALTVGQAALTVDADDASKTYDGLAYSGGNGVTYTGFVNSETSAVLGGSLSYAGTSQGATNAGGYVLTPQGQTSSNYNITFTNGALTVNQAALSVTADADSKTYDGLAYSGGNGVTYSGFVNSETSAVLGGSLSYAGTSQGATNVGGYVLTPQGQTSSNYNITFNDGALIVGQAALTIDADDASKTYDGLAYSGGNGVTYTGFVNSETSAVLGGTLSYTGTSQGATNVGGYVLTPQGQTSSNYNITFTNGALTVNQAALSVTADADSKTYDGLAYSGGNGVTYSGFVNSETSAVLGGSLSYAGTSQGATNAGGYLITPQGQTSGNYAITFADGALTVGQAALTVDADDASKTYDGLAYSGGNGVTYTGFVNSETSAVLGGALSYVGTSQGATNAGGYVLTPQGQTSSNYNITFTNGDLVVNKALLTYVADTATKVYGDANPAASGNLTGFVNSETSAVLGGTSSWATPATVSSDAGSYAITGSGYTSGNYDFAQHADNTTALTITQATITYIADVNSIIYGDADPALTGSVTGFKLGQDESALGGTVDWVPTSTGTSNVGTYGTNGTGYTSNNYTFVQAGSNATALTVTPANLTYNANTVGREYGEANPILTGTIAGLKNGELLTDVTDGSAIWLSGASNVDGVGDYAVYGLGLSVVDSNYNLQITQAAANDTSLTITPAELTYVADSVSRQFGNDNPALTGGLTGFKNGQTVGNLTGTVAWSTPATIVSEEGTYAINGSGYSSANYTFTQAGANASALTVLPTTIVVNGEEVIIIEDGGDWRLVNRGGNIEIMDTDNPGAESADIITANSMERDMQFPEVSMQATPGYQIEFDISVDDQADIEQTGAGQPQQVIASISSYDMETEDQNLGFGAYYTADHQNNPAADFGYIGNGEGISPDDVIGELIDGLAPSQNDDEEEEEE